MGPRAGLDGRKISSPPGFDPGPSNLQSVTILTELPGPHLIHIHELIHVVSWGKSGTAVLVSDSTGLVAAV